MFVCFDITTNLLIDDFVASSIVLLSITLLFLNLIDLFSYLRFYYSSLNIMSYVHYLILSVAWIFYLYLSATSLILLATSNSFDSNNYLI